jgi:nucleotide-binding universal stress UspA family protein
VSDDDTLFLLHVWDFEPVTVPEEYARVTTQIGDLNQHLEQEAQKQAAELLEAYAMRCKKLDIEAKTVLKRNSDPREAILEFCKQEQPDMLMISSRGSTSADAVPLGSTTTYCVQYCNCPVLVIRQQGAIAESDE